MSVQVKELLNSTQSSPSDLTAELCMARILAWGGQLHLPALMAPGAQHCQGQAALSWGWAGGLCAGCFEQLM